MSALQLALVVRPLWLCLSGVAVLVASVVVASRSALGLSAPPIARRTPPPSCCKVATKGEDPMRMLTARDVLPVLLLSAAGCTSIPYTVDTHVRSTPETVVWGQLPGGRAPVARVQPGATVSIDTVSHQG